MALSLFRGIRTLARKNASSRGLKTSHALLRDSVAPPLSPGALAQPVVGDSDPLDGVLLPSSLLGGGREVHLSAEEEARHVLQEQQDLKLGFLKDESLREFLGKSNSAHKMKSQLFLDLDHTLMTNHLIKIKQALKIVRGHGYAVSASRYNLILLKCIDCGNVETYHEIAQFMKEDNVKPNAETLAIQLLFHASQGQQKEANNLIKNLIKVWWPQGQPLNLSPDHIKKVEAEIHRVDPNFSFAARHSKDKQLVDEAFRAQLRNETNVSTRLASERVLAQREDAGEAVAEKGPKASPFFAVWRNDLLRAIEAEASKNPMDASMQLVMPFLSREEIADSLISGFEAHLRDNLFGAKMSRLAGTVGRELYRRFFMKESAKLGEQQPVREIYLDYVSRVTQPGALRHHTHAEIYKAVLSSHGHDPAKFGNEFIPIWTSTQILSIGGYFINVMLQTCRINRIPGQDPSSTTPAFYHTYDFEKEFQFGVIKAHNAVMKFHGAKQEGPDLETISRSFETWALPMLTPPRPWISPSSSPYLLLPAHLVRCGDDAFQHYDIISHSKHEFPELYDALNVISSCPWRVNEAVLDVVNDLYFSSEPYPHLDIPAKKMPFLEQLIDNKKQEMSGSFRGDLVNEIRIMKKEIRENFALRADMSHQIKVLNAFKGKVFYLPHNIDFRGRCYPIAPHINQMRGDMVRGLLQFGEGKPLGPNGLRWLKIHLANVCGQDKISFSDREKFADANMHNILASADNPINSEGKVMWWQTTDKPWQCLATCVEIARAVRSGDPASFVSHHPVHQDGTCNGLQHYAALGGDVMGARHVNLCRTEQDKPQDVYSAVLERVNRLIHAHTKDPTSIPEKYPKYAASIAPLLIDPPITRKVIKQTVMTSVYGVTYIGARDQIKKQLNSSHTHLKCSPFEAASYLTMCVFDSLGELFFSARKIQDWLNDVAKMIARTGEPVMWFTPMHFPVLQPYHRPMKITINSPLQKIIAVDTSNPYLLPDTARQCSAFPPNFIHSLDSTHMLYTASACSRDEITFMAVHDSYWTHAATVEGMSRHCREQFVHLHSQPILERLYHFFLLNYQAKPFLSSSKKKDPSALAEPTNLQIPPMPARGEFDVRLVKDSVYFFN